MAKSAVPSAEPARLTVSVPSRISAPAPAPVSETVQTPSLQRVEYDVASAQAAIETAASATVGRAGSRRGDLMGPILDHRPTRPRWAERPAPVRLIVCPHVRVGAVHQQPEL